MLNKVFWFLALLSTVIAQDNSTVANNTLQVDSDDIFSLLNSSSFLVENLTLYNNTDGILIGSIPINYDINAYTDSILIGSIHINYDNNTNLLNIDATLQGKVYLFSNHTDDYDIGDYGDNDDDNDNGGSDDDEGDGLLIVLRNAARDRCGYPQHCKCPYGSVQYYYDYNGCRKCKCIKNNPCYKIRCRYGYYCMKGRCVPMYMNGNNGMMGNNGGTMGNNGGMSGNNGGNSGNNGGMSGNNGGMGK